MPISDKEYIADLGECMTKLEADLAALREENARLRQRVEECEREHPPEPEYTAWWEAGKPDVTKLRQRVEEEHARAQRMTAHAHDSDCEAQKLALRVEELEREAEIAACDPCPHVEPLARCVEALNYGLLLTASWSDVRTHNWRNGVRAALAAAKGGE